MCVSSLHAVLYIIEFVYSLQQVVLKAKKGPIARLQYAEWGFATPWATFSPRAAVGDGLDTQKNGGC